jgi:hypothetical protein
VDAEVLEQRLDDRIAVGDPEGNMVEGLRLHQRGVPGELNY